MVKRWLVVREVAGARFNINLRYWRQRCVQANGLVTAGGAVLGLPSVSDLSSELTISFPPDEKNIPF